MGLVLGANLALIGLTGSINVFYRELDAALNPALFSDGRGPAKPPSEILRVARMAMSEPVVFLQAPDPVWPVWTALREHDGRLWATTIDRGGAVLGSRDFEGSLVFTIYELHAALLLRPWWGTQFVGVLGLALLASAGSGVYLWWPRKAVWRALFALHRRPSTLLYVGLHKLAGIWICAALVPVAAAGVGVVFPGLIRPLVNAISPVAVYPSPAGAPRAEAMRVDASQAIAIAMAWVDNADAASVTPPHPPGHAWSVVLRDRRASTADRGIEEVWIDPWSGAVLGAFTPGTANAGTRFMQSLLWIHNGSLFGWPGRVLVFLSGLALPILFITGVLAWLRKSAARRALERRRADAKQPSFALGSHARQSGPISHGD